MGKKSARALVLGIAFSCSAIYGAQVDRAYSAPSFPGSVPPEMRLDVNHATLEELIKIPGMTRTWAMRIIRFRPYRTKQDLLEKGIVSSQVYRRIRDYLIAHRADN